MKRIRPIHYLDYAEHQTGCGINQHRVFTTYDIAACTCGRCLRSPLGKAAKERVEEKARIDGAAWLRDCRY